ncbi:unnamed protein product [Leuciscus chuanchicus]
MDLVAMVRAVTISTSFLQYRHSRFIVGTSRKVAAGLVIDAGISMFRKEVRALQGAADVVQLLPFSPLRWRAVLWLTAGDLSPFFILKEPTA